MFILRDSYLNEIKDEIGKKNKKTHGLDDGNWKILFN